MYSKNIYRRLTEFGQPMWQAEADTELTLSASPATAVGQILLTMAKFCENTVNSNKENNMILTSKTNLHLRTRLGLYAIQKILVFTKTFS